MTADQCLLSLSVWLYVSMWKRAGNPGKSSRVFDFNAHIALQVVIIQVVASRRVCPEYDFYDIRACGQMIE